MKKLLKVIPLLVAALVLSACSSSEDNSASSESTTCSPESLATVEAGTLTIATGEPAYYPWVIDDKPESGEGFEAAVAYAVAQELGYDNAAVKWVRTSFDAAIAPGPKTFDFNLQQYSITDERKQVVDFSSPYYKSNQRTSRSMDSLLTFLQRSISLPLKFQMESSLARLMAATLAIKASVYCSPRTIQLPPVSPRQSMPSVTTERCKQSLISG